MPHLRIPKTQRRVKTTPPAQISHPEHLARQAHGGMEQLGAILANTGKAFMSEMLQNRERQEIAEGEMLIKEAFYSIYNQEKTGADNNGNYLDPSESQERTDNFHTMATKIIEGAKGRGAQAYLKAQYTKDAPDFQRKILEVAKDREQSEGLIKYAKWLQHEQDTPLYFYLEGEPTVENLGKGIKEKISKIEQGIYNWYETNPKLLPQKAQFDIAKIHQTIPMNAAQEIVYPMGRTEGLKWLKKNWKKLHLTLENYGRVQEQLKEVWEDEEAIFKEEQKILFEQTTSEIWDSVLGDDYKTAQELVNNSNLPVKGIGGKKFWTDYIRKKTNQIISGKDVIDDPDTVYAAGIVIDGLWMGEFNWSDLTLALAEYEKEGKLSKLARNNLIKQAKIKLEEHQKREWMAIKTEAKNRIMLVPGPEDIGWGEYISGKTDIEKDEAVERHKKEVFRFNEFRGDFIEWMNRHSKATFYDMQEHRIDLLYGRYTDVTDKLLQKRIETALEYDIEDEVTVDGITRIYMGGNRWKLKK